jgi:dihydrolipoamide dehydrogenase
MLGKKDTMRYNAVPSVIYTSPEAASVGETEQSAAANGLAVDAVTVPIAFSGRFLAENTDRTGFCKVIADKSNRRIIGVHILGPYASEIIASACIMIEMEMTVDDAREVIFPHPCVSEIIREAVFKL